MEIEQLIWSQPVAGVTAFSVPRGQVDARNPYSEHNLCNYTGDDALRVLNARLELCQQLGITLDTLVMPHQTHGTRVAVIDNDFLNADIAVQEQALDGVDALVTRLPGVCIGVNTADCVPIVLLDSDAAMVAVVHAGWRGTVSRIVSEAVRVMEQHGAQARRMLATMGVSIGPECFEVGDEVCQAFQSAGFDMAAISSRNAATGKAHIDLRRANAEVLLQAGLRPENIVASAPCSRCEPQRYFSARKLGVKSGRTFTGVMLNSQSV